MTGGLLATLLATSSTEFSPKYSLAFETGTLAHYDPHWSLISYWQDPSVGLRFGYNISSKIALTGSYQGANSSGTINYGGDYDYYYDEEGNYTETYSGLGNVEAEIQENIITVGPKINFGSVRWFVPYASVQGIVVHGRLEMGDSTYEEDEATTYFKDSAMGVGALGALGLELRTRPIAGRVQPIMYFEYGGGITSNLNFSIPSIGVGGDDMPIGDLQYGGQHFRFGVGAQF